MKNEKRYRHRNWLLLFLIWLHFKYELGKAFLHYVLRRLAQQRRGIRQTDLWSIMCFFVVSGRNLAMTGSSGTSRKWCESILAACRWRTAPFSSSGERIPQALWENHTNSGIRCIWTTYHFDRGLYFGLKTIFFPLIWKLYFCPSCGIGIVLRLFSCPFCLNSSLICIYFNLLLSIFSFSFPFLSFSFHFLYFSPQMTSADVFPPGGKYFPNTYPCILVRKCSHLFISWYRSKAALHFEVDPDPTFQFDADPEHLLLIDPDPASHNYRQGRTQGGCTGCTCTPPPPLCIPPLPSLKGGIWEKMRQITGGEVGQPKMCIPPGKILGTPLTTGTCVWKNRSFFKSKIIYFL